MGKSNRFNGFDDNNNTRGKRGDDTRRMARERKGSFLEGGDDGGLPMMHEVFSQQQGNDRRRGDFRRG